MKAIHNFLDAGRVVPPVEIENVDVIRAKLLQGRFDGEMQRLGAVSDIMRLLRNFLRCSTTLPRRGVFSSDYHLIAVLTLLHPFSNEQFRGLVLVIVGRIDKVATGFVERVEQLEAVLLVHGTHAEISPLVADAHSTKLKG